MFSVAARSADLAIHALHQLDTNLNLHLLENSFKYSQLSRKAEPALHKTRRGDSPVRITRTLQRNLQNLVSGHYGTFTIYSNKNCPLREGQHVILVFNVTVKETNKLNSFIAVKGSTTMSASDDKNCQSTHI
jgi:hypothetical protein